MNEGPGDEGARFNACLTEAPPRDGETTEKQDLKRQGVAELMRNTNLQNQKHSIG